MSNSKDNAKTPEIIDNSENRYTIWDLYKTRPRYKDSKELQERLKLYYEIVKEAQIPLTYMGLVLILGLNDKHQLSDLRYDATDGAAIKAAIATVEGYYESRLSLNSCVGAIFALKNMGWSDSQQVSLTGGDNNPAALQRTQAQLAILQNLRDSKEGQQ